MKEISEIGIFAGKKKKPAKEMKILILANTKEAELLVSWYSLVTGDSVIRCDGG